MDTGSKRLSHSELIDSVQDEGRHISSSDSFQPVDIQNMLMTMGFLLLCVIPVFGYKA